MTSNIGPKIQNLTLEYLLLPQCDPPGGGGGGGGGGGLGGFLVIGQWGCAAGWGRIFRAGLTIMGLHFH